MTKSSQFHLFPSKNMNEYYVVMVFVSSILTLQLIIKINNMFKVKQNDKFSQPMNKQELYQTTKMSQNNSTKLVSEYDKESFDKWMESLIIKNGTTNY